MAKSKFRDDERLKNHKLNDDLKNGPVHKRKCTDWWFCPVFLLAIFAMIIISIIGYVEGDPLKLATPFDKDGNQCGVSKGYEDYNLIYFGNPLFSTKNSSSFLSVCVRACPYMNSDTGTFENLAGSTLYSDDSSQDSGKKKDKSGVNFSDMSAATEIFLEEFEDEYDLDPLLYRNTERLKCKQDDECDIDFINYFLYDTQVFINRYCMPNINNEFLLSFYEKILDQYSVADKMEQWNSDLKLTFGVIIAMAGLAVVIGLIFMCLIQLLAPIITWCMIILSFSILIVGGIVCYIKAEEYGELVPDPPNTDDSNYDTERTLKAFAIFFWAAAGITIIIVMCFYHKLKVALAVIKTAAQFIKYNLLILIFPPITAALVVGFFAYWVTAVFYIYSLGDPVADEPWPVPTISHTTNQKYMIYFHFFMLLWVNAFILAFSTFVIASAACIWYFNFSGQHRLWPIRTSLWRGLFYHMGSLAFGSFILAVIQAIRVIFAYMNKKLKDAKADNNAIVRWLLKIVHCLLWCFEKCIRFLNKNAYIQIAINSEHFCRAAFDAFCMIFKHPSEFLLVTVFGEVWMFIGKIFIAGISTLVGYIIITEAPKYADELYNPFIPTAIMFIFTYTIGLIFMQVYGVAATAILQCYIVQKEFADGHDVPEADIPTAMRDLIKHNHKQYINI